MLYPFCYLLYSIMRGAITNYYPYPFIDVNKIGYAKTFTNAGFVFIGFLLLGALFIGYDKIKKQSVGK